MCATAAPPRERERGESSTADSSRSTLLYSLPALLVGSLVLPSGGGGAQQRSAAGGFLSLSRGGSRRSRPLGARAQHLAPSLSPPLLSLLSLFLNPPPPPPLPPPRLLVSALFIVYPPSRLLFLPLPPWISSPSSLSLSLSLSSLSPLRIPIYSGITDRGTARGPSLRRLSLHSFSFSPTLTSDQPAHPRPPAPSIALHRHPSPSLALSPSLSLSRPPPSLALSSSLFKPTYHNVRRTHQWPRCQTAVVRRGRRSADRRSSQVSGAYQPSCFHQRQLTSKLKREREGRMRQAPYGEWKATLPVVDIPSVACNLDGFWQQGQGGQTVN